MEHQFMISTIKSLVNPKKKKKKNYKVVAFTIPLNGASNSTLLHQSLGLDRWLYRVRFKQKKITTYILKNGRKLHFTALNYISDYTLHSKLFKCTFCTINYDHCHILHPDVKFSVNFDEKVWHYVKRSNCSSSQSLKNK